MSIRAMAQSDSVRAAYIQLGWLYEPGNPELSALVNRLGAGNAVAALKAQPLDRSLIRRELHARPVDQLWTQAQVAAQANLDQVVVPVDPGWPDGLDVNGPLCLWTRGPAAPPRFARAIAVTGSRACTFYGTHVATELGSELSARGYTIVTDGGFGIAAAAIRGALLSNHPAVVVASSGLDRLFPPRHQDLFRTVATNGLLLSAYAPGAEPTGPRSQYARRLLAELTAGTVLVEAAARASAITTVRHAADIGRRAFIVPGPITSAHSLGCLQLLRDDTRIRPIAGPVQVIDDLQK